MDGEGVSLQTFANVSAKARPGVSRTCLAAGSGDAISSDIRSGEELFKLVESGEIGSVLSFAEGLFAGSVGAGNRGRVGPIGKCGPCPCMSWSAFVFFSGKPVPIEDDLANASAPSAEAPLSNASRCGANQSNGSKRLSCA